MVVGVYKDANNELHLFTENPRSSEVRFWDFLGFTILSVTQDELAAAVANKATDNVMSSFSRRADEKADNEIDEQPRPESKKEEVDGLYVADPSAPNLSPAIFYNRIEAKDWLAEVGGGTLHAVGEFEWKSLVPAKREANA